MISKNGVNLGTSGFWATTVGRHGTQWNGGGNRINKY